MIFSGRYYQNQKVESSIPIEQDKTDSECGMGRLVKLSKPSKLKNLVSNIKEQLRLDHVQVALSKMELNTTLRQLPFVLALEVVFLKELKQIYITQVNYRIMKHCFQKNPDLQ